MGLAQGLNILQRSAEDFANLQKENQQAHDTAIGNRKLYDIAVQAGVLDMDQQIKFNKGNDTTKNNILDGAMRAWNAQREMQQDEQRKQAFQLDQKRFEMEQGRYNYQMPAAAAEALDQSGHVAIPVQHGQIQIVPKARPTPTQEQRAESQKQAEAAGGTLVTMPDGTVRFEKKTAPAAPPMPTVDVPGVGQLPAASELGQARVKELNPAGVIHQTYGAKPHDFLPENVEIGEVPFNDPKKYDFDPNSNVKNYARLKSTGTTMTRGEYTKWLNQLADAGQLDGPVKNPFTGETVTPAQKAAAVAANPKELDYSNPTSMAIVQGFLTQARGDPVIAKQLAQDKGYTWPH